MSSVFWPLVCILALSGVATLLVWSLLWSGAQADAANEAYAEELRKLARDGSRANTGDNDADLRTSQSD